MKKFVQRGKLLALPIEGDTISEICLGLYTVATLIFKDDAGDESQLQIQQNITLHYNGADLSLLGSRPGRIFDPEQLYPLLGLLGTQVVDAWAHKEGMLEISFSNESVLRVLPEDPEDNGGYETWHFQYPRPGRLVGGNLNNSISLHGLDGGLN